MGTWGMVVSAFAWQGWGHDGGTLSSVSRWHTVLCESAAPSFCRQNGECCLYRWQFLVKTGHLATRVGTPKDGVGGGEGDRQTTGHFEGELEFLKLWAGPKQRKRVLVLLLDPIFTSPSSRCYGYNYTKKFSNSL